MPISRAELCRRLRKFGYSGPYPGKKHSFMRKGNHKIRIPNPHGPEIDDKLLAKILKQAGISKKEWDDLN